MMCEELFADGFMSIAPIRWALENETAAINVEVRPAGPSLLPTHRLRQCVDALRGTGKPLRCVLLLTDRRESQCMDLEST